MSVISSVVRGWSAAPRPTFEYRNESARWRRGRPVQTRHTLRVAQVIQETPSTRSFVLAAPDGGAPNLPYRAGQHLTLLVSHDGSTQRRCYSFSTSPLSKGLPQITVKRVEGGAVSRHLHDAVRVGDLLTSLDPTGDFTVETNPAAPRRLAMIAGGVGITPLMSLAETVLLAEPASRVTLLCGNRSEAEIIFRHRLDALAREHAPRVTVRHALEEAPEGWSGLCGALDGAQVVEAIGGGAVDAWFVCGPEPMMQSVCTALAASGVPRERVRTERFAYATASGARIPDHEATVHFAASGRSVRTRPGQTLLAAGLEAGVALPSSCTMGGCGACKVRKSSGTVAMSEPNCLSESERDAGWILACCSYADSDLVIEGF
jgi:ring-1,2-phenylacetyl-CoA epoxidase subunit PaaE